MTTVMIAVVVLAVLGAIFGLVLAIASKVFAVEVDPREEAILGCLPGANCGGCGYPGCSGYASAVVKGVAPVNACAAGGEAVAAQIGEIMGVSAGAAVKQIAQVHCTGCGQNYKQYTYVGIHDCVAASKLPGGGDLGCAYGCLGLGSCEKACPFEAIHVIDGVARVDEEKCKACNKCVDICPRHIIALEPYKTKRHVTIPCSSHDKGVDARKVCDNGCIGCSLCAKSCPKEAITMVNNLAVIDYEKCIGCGICAQKCPRKLITVDGKVPEVKPAAPRPPRLPLSSPRLQLRRSLQRRPLPPLRPRRLPSPRSKYHKIARSRSGTRDFAWMDGSALAAAAVVAQLEGGALGGGAVGHVGVAATHLDLVQGAVVLLAAVVSTTVHRALDAVVGGLVHGEIPP